ncbi:Sec-independent protein translocase subunit TatA [Saccharopolyspora phatthalungensis]|uniref:Sec-independent protein translocase protein TatA n=1 Tax=Saccharopolyspora phatthalungensis TaxID=664693 RepID=A0A840QJX5_9PSEU|nr:Sec-independent protein translocase subunit TatA [Saccharopolyspora phatthalungensis]MBB5159549.1 sec-independent protein translocase protein TatA [Saccharopolyspora phatthalungensis]
MGSLSAWHWLIVLAAVVLLFGSTKLPQMARSLGQSARVFKAEARGLKADEEAARLDRAEREQKRESAAGDSGPPSAASPSPLDEKQRNDPRTD